MSPNINLTNAGKEILAKGLIGKQIRFSKVAFGAGDFNYDTESVADLTELKDWRMDLPLVDKRMDGDGTVTIVALCTNFELTEGFPAKEIGVFAKDPDTDAEVLYAYKNVGDEYNFIPAKTGPVVKNARFAYIVEIQDAENVSFDINFAFAYVSMDDFEAHINSTEPHPNTPTHFDDVENFDCFWVTDSDSDLHKISVDEVKKILGIVSSENKTTEKISTDEDFENVTSEETGLNVNDFAANFLPENVSRETNDLENLSEFVETKAEIGLAEPNILLIENFNPATLIDDTKIKITSCAKGSDLISAVSLDGVKVGAEYFLSDGVSCETIKIANIIISTSSIEISGANFIFKTETALENSYNLDETFLLRSNVSPENKKIVGNLPVQSRLWRGRRIFSGIAANVTQILKLDFAAENAAAFNVSGDGFFADGKFCLT